MFSLMRREAVRQVTAKPRRKRLIALTGREGRGLKAEGSIRTRVASFCSGLSSLPDAVRNGVYFDVEADFGFGRRRWWGHELADGAEDRLELGILSALQVGQFASEVGVGREHFTQAHEAAHDGDVDLHGAGAAKHTG